MVESGRDRDEGVTLFLGHALTPVHGVLGEVELVHVPALTQITLIECDVAGQPFEITMHVREHVVDVKVPDLGQVRILDGRRPGRGQLGGITGHYASS